MWRYDGFGMRVARPALHICLLGLGPLKIDEVIYYFQRIEHRWDHWKALDSWVAAVQKGRLTASVVPVSGPCHVVGP